MDNPKIWYAVIDGKADGPHEEQTIRQWLTTGKLNYSDLVFRSGLTRWVNVAECKEFERRGADRVLTETVAKFQVPIEEEENTGWIALVKHGEVDGKHHYIQSGPYTSLQVHEKLKKGDLKYEDHLWTKGYQNWTPIRVIVEFERRVEKIETLPKPAAAAASVAMPAPEIKPEIKAESKPKPEADIQNVAIAPTVEFEIQSNAAPAASSDTKSIAIPSAPIMFDDDATPVKPISDKSFSDKASIGKPPVVEFAAADIEKSVTKQTIPTVTLQKMMNDTKMEVTNFGHAGTNTEALRAGVGLKIPKPGMGNTEAAKSDMLKVDHPNKIEFPKTASPKVEAMEAIATSSTPHMPSATPQIRPEMPRPEMPRPEMPRPEMPRPEMPRPETPMTETPKAAPTKTETMKTEITKSGVALPKIEDLVRTESVPKVEHPKSESTPKAAGMGMPLSSKDSSAPPPVIPGRDKPKAKPEEEPEFVDEIMDDVTAVPGNRRRQRFVIATVCALLAMAMVYAGIAAYRETLRKDFFKKSPPVAAIRNTLPNRQTASNNGALPDPFGDRNQVPVNPEVENPVRPARTLRVVSLKTTTDHPQLVMETDLPGGTQIHIEITARSGAILTYPSFKLVKDIAVQPGSMPSVDLSSDKLQPGDYTVSVRGGGLVGASPLSVGVHNANFKKALVAFKKKVAKEQKTEKAEIKDHMLFMAKSYSSLTKTYRAARNPAMADAKRKWNSLIKSWKKDFESKARDVKALNDRTRNKYAYPDQLSLVKGAEIKLLDVYRQYDRSLKAGREVASDSNAPDQFKQAFRELQKSTKNLK